MIGTTIMAIRMTIAIVMQLCDDSNDHGDESGDNDDGFNDDGVKTMTTMPSWRRC